MIKFTYVKLIPKYFFIACVVILFSFNGNSIARQNEYSTAESFQVADTNTVDKSANSVILELFFTDEEIILLKEQFVEFGYQHIPPQLQALYFIIINKSFEYPLILLFIALVLFFILNIIGVFIVFDNTIKRKSYEERYIKVYGKMYEEVLLSYMFQSIDWETALIKLKKHERKENRKILISVLMNFQTNFKGEMEHFIPEIYTKLGLDKDSIRLANSYYDHKKVKGIIELINLHPKGAKGIVEKLINDSNDYVRAEAQTAYIRLNPDAPFNFFYKLEQPFTRWTQLSAFNLIRLHSLPVPSFGQFLNFKHVNIRNFSLRMITFFQQLESGEEVIKMVDNSIEQTRYLAYKAINDLRLYTSHEIIKNRFAKETPRNKIEIIKALRNIGLSEDFDFLLDVLKNGTISMKTEACRTLYYLNEETKERLMQIDQRTVPEIELLISHVTDSRN